MDAAQALADLTEISSQIQAAVLLDDSGAVTASTFSDEDRAARVARAAQELLAAAGRVRAGSGQTLTQLEAATLGGSVFIARDGGHTIAATTTVGSARSEEHTSELQSLAYLVCRLLLEKKKNT